VLVLRRLELLRSPTRLESVLSREATFLYNNLLLVALCLTILWGVIYPIVSEAVRGEAATVGPPYYNFFLRAFGLPLLLLMGIGPLIAWRRASLSTLKRTFAVPVAVALAAGGVLLALGAGRSPIGLAAYTFCAFVLGSIVLEFVQGTRARMALSDDGPLRAFNALVARNRRRYGGYVVHAAIVLLAIGIVGSSVYDSHTEARLRPGESLAVGDYRLTLRRTTERDTANARELRAVVHVERAGKDLGTLEPGKNAYPVEDQVSNEMAIRSDKLTGEDLLVIAEQINANGTVDFRALVLPLVNLIWLAGGVFLAGSLIALWPDAREQRRLALRYEGRLIEA
jgi:cytochrome c-type biogenesis protein CcmF